MCTQNVSGSSIRECFETNLELLRACTTMGRSLDKDVWVVKNCASYLEMVLDELLFDRYIKG